LESEIDCLKYVTTFDFQHLSGDVVAEFERWESEDRLGFMQLPAENELLELSKELASRLRERTRMMLVAGIGGSSLGLRALLAAFPEYDRSVRVVDSPDSRQLAVIRTNNDPKECCLTVITKSGGTAETLSIFMSLHDWIHSATGDELIIAVTDPEKGDLRRLAKDRSWSSLPVPPNVGGRFSVLSPVGIFPAAYAGIDVDGLMAGAGAVVSDFRDRGAGSMAAVLAASMLANFHSHPVHAMFTYDDRLIETGFWFAQLWAESLGKKQNLHGNTVHVGQTPLSCRGPADQHSLVQLFMEGPMDKAVTILTTPEMKDPDPMPSGFEEYPSLSYLTGMAPDRLRVTEAIATGRALEERGVPVSYLALEKLDERTLGAVLMTYEIATVLAGLALGVDPLDQPGVERGKILAYEALGRPGYGDR
jgi:glucose-6-phosphate isomerase